MPVTDLKSKNGLEISQYFRSKKLEELDISDLAYIHLGTSFEKTVLENCIISSSLYYLINTVRASFNTDRTRIYSPLLSLFAILDQIGGIYGSTLSHTPRQNGIKVALATFSKYKETEIQKLYSLRNGLYHDGSLVNIGKHNNTNVIFRLSHEKPNTITNPPIEWDGTYHDSLDQYITTINIDSFKDDIEEIIKKCREELLNGTLTIKISSKREFFYKFLFITTYT